MPAENGYVPTPPPVADLAAAQVFGVTRPSEIDGGGRLLLPGLGTGNLYAAARRYCTNGESWRVPGFDYPLPSCVGVENDPQRIDDFRSQHSLDGIEIHEADFLLDPPARRFDWGLANPPFTRYSHIDEDRRAVYRDRFETATGQFPLYAPFVEQMIELVKPGGSVTVILPIKALTNTVTAPLRRLLQRFERGHILLLPEPTFDRMVTTVMLTFTNTERPSEMWWVENVLPYGPRPLLKRLGVEDVATAADAYMERLKDRNRWVMNRAPVEMQQAAASSADSADTADQQTTLGGWTE